MVAKLITRPGPSGLYNVTFKGATVVEDRNVPKLTREQAAIIGAYTGIACGPFSDLHQLVEILLGRSVWTHELGSPELWVKIKEEVKPMFLDILHGESEA